MVKHAKISLVRSMLLHQTLGGARMTCLQKIFYDHGCRPNFMVQRLLPTGHSYLKYSGIQTHLMPLQKSSPKLSTMRKSVYMLLLKALQPFMALVD
jgi:hypothetical protein